MAETPKIIIKQGSTSNIEMKFGMVMYEEL